MKTATFLSSFLGRVSIAGVLGGALGWAALGGSSRAEAPPRVQPIVETAAVEIAGPAEVRFAVVTRAVDRARVGFTMPGRVVARPVKVGDAVRAGQVIARLDPAPFANAVASQRATRAQVAARLDQAKRDEARSVGLATAGAAGSEELEKTRSGVRTLQAQLDQIDAGLEEAKRRQRESTLKAPFAGVVTDVFLEAGELTGAGQPIVAVAGAGSTEAELRLPAAWRDAVAVGDHIRARSALDRAAKPIDVVVASRGLVSDGPGRLFPVRLTFPEGTGAGRDFDVFLARPEADAPSVPSAAVTSPVGRGTFVYVVKDERAHRVPVEVRRLVGDRAVVRGEVAAGDRVVVAGHAALLDDDVVVERRLDEGRAAR